MKTLIPITVLTGFLGSGKTTLLNRLLSSEAPADIAVLINEFGKVALDHLLVDTLEEEIILLESGCVCCAVRDNFNATLLMLYNKREKQLIPPFQHVILETTGIADPVSIHELILTDKEVRRRYFCKQIITVVDAVYGESNLDRHIEAVKQVSVADKIIISKTDLCGGTQVQNTEMRIHKLNPLAPRSHSSPDNKSVPDELLNGENHAHVPSAEPGRRNKHTGYSSSHGHDRRFSTFSLCWPETVEWEDFIAWLEALLVARGKSIHRLKGLLNVNGERRPIVIQGVQHSFYPPTKLEKWPGAQAKTELVFITSDFTRQAAINSLCNILDVSVE
ncbi:MAG: GTP-binding protein [Gammaproteobacteria bacterium]|nr:GTP-binding protein [Gammaproteobacteria bacterium]